MTTKKTHMQEKMIRLTKRAYAKAYYETHKAEALARYQRDKERIKARSAKRKVDSRERYLKQQAAYDFATRGIANARKPTSEYAKEAHKVLSAWQQGKTSTKQ